MIPLYIFQLALLTKASREVYWQNLWEGFDSERSESERIRRKLEQEALAAVQFSKTEEPAPRLRSGPFDLRGLYHPSEKKVFDARCAKISAILNLG